MKPSKNNFRFFAVSLGITAPLWIAAASLPADAGTFQLYDGGDNVVVNQPDPLVPDPYSFQLTSDTTTPGAPGYGGMYYTSANDPLDTTLTLNTLTELSADYEMTEGTFGGGAPRFTIFDFNGNSAYIYWGTPDGFNFTDPNAGSWANTGNYADPTSDDLRVALNGFGGQNTPNSFETYAQAEAAVGNTEIQYITVDLDGGFTGTQQMLVDNFTVNDESFNAQAVPEPASFSLIGVGALALLRRRRRTPQ
jgi:PEP-CTERM motif-containing protein